MFHRWPIVVFGLSGVVALGLAFNVGRARLAQNDVVARASEALESGGFDWATVEGARGEVTLGGEAPDAGERRAALLLVEGMDWVRSIEDTTSLAPVAEPVTVPLELTLLKDRTTLTLSGSVPAGLGADLGGVEDDGMLNLLRDDAVPAPDGWQEIARAVVDGLTQLETGSATLMDTGGTVEGLAETTAIRDAVAADLRDAAGDWPLTVTLEAPPALVIEGVDSAEARPPSDLTPAEEPLAEPVAVAALVPVAPEVVENTAPMPDDDRTEVATASPAALFTPDPEIPGDGDEEDESVDLDAAVEDAVIEEEAGDAPSDEAVAIAGESPPEIQQPTAEAPAFLFKAYTSGDMIVTEGMTTEDARAGLSALAGISPGAEIADAAPDDVRDEAVVALVPLLSRLERGSLTIEGQRVTLDGAAPDPAQSAALFAAALPEGYTIESSLVPMAETRAHGLYIDRRADNTLTLSGFAPDAGFGTAVEGYAKAVFGAGAVSGTLRTIEPEDPMPDPDWPAAVSTALEALSPLTTGSAMVRRGLISIDGTGPEFAVSLAQETLEISAPPGYRTLAVLEQLEEEPDTSLSLEDCETLFNIVAARDGLSFAADGTELSSDSQDVVIQLAAMAQNCGDGIVEVVGHADGSGNAGEDLRLSAERARAVRDALADSGVLPARLRSRGQGSTRPVTDENGRVRTDRIEFRIFNPN